jgi:hypothetical protein
MFTWVHRYCIGGASWDTTFCVLTGHESHMEDLCDRVGDRHCEFVRRLLEPRLLWQSDEG